MTAEQERAAIVKWLWAEHDSRMKIYHEQQDRGVKDYYLFRASAFGFAADTIDRGDHHKGE